MKSQEKSIKLFVLISFLFITLPIFSCNAENEKIGTNHESTQISKIKKILINQKNNIFSNNDFELEFIGNTNNQKSIYSIYLYKKEFGNKRLTKRLIIFSKNNDYLGMYDIPEIPTRIEGNKVYFPIEEKWGNSITFDGDSPPKQIYLDGESYSFFRGDEKN